MNIQENYGDPQNFEENIEICNEEPEEQNDPISRRPSVEMHSI